MKALKRKQIEFPWRVSEVAFLPPPTVPPVSWAEARADYRRGPVVGCPSDVMAYFRQYIGGKGTEAFLVDLPPNNWSI
jgi:hypothetical protein